MDLNLYIYAHTHTPVSQEQDSEAILGVRFPGDQQILKYSNQLFWNQTIEQSKSHKSHFLHSDVSYEHEL